MATLGGAECFHVHEFHSFIHSQVPIVFTTSLHAAHAERAEMGFKGEDFFMYINASPEAQIKII